MTKLKVLVIGVILADLPNHADRILMAFSQATQWSVQQKWHVIGALSPHHDQHVQSQSNHREDKITILNRIIDLVSLDDYEYVFVSDDDITIPEDFVDRYLTIVQHRGYAVSQPARTHKSYIDHYFVSQLMGVESRLTRFVEIGPIVCIHRSAFATILPFDTRAPMGWGLDFHWPCLLADQELTMGVVDYCPVEHSLRKPVTSYCYEETEHRMRDFLGAVDHVSYLDAFSALKTFPSATATARPEE
jgi:hypothetical protein